LECDLLKRKNDKVNTIVELQRTAPIHTHGAWGLISNVASVTPFHDYNMSMVYFSCPMGCATHVDMLNPEVYHPVTYLIPIVLPHKGHSVLMVGADHLQLKPEYLYEFDHSIPHSLEVSDPDGTGCVVAMIAVRRK